MSLTFTYEALPGRVTFGRGASESQLAMEIERLGVERVMVIATVRERDLAERLMKPFADKVATFFVDVQAHVPSEVAVKARSKVAAVNADALLSVGGGSTTGTAKIVALTTGLPIVAVPTTYAGSEMTPVWGMTTASRKQTGKDMAVLPKVVIYDPDLVETLPRALAVASALNAMAHCVEALWTCTANPVTTMMALDGSRAIAKGIRTESTESAVDLLYGAYLAGATFAVSGSGLHHKICHALGGAFNLPHAETHAVVLPHVLAFNTGEPELRSVMGRLGDAIGGSDPLIALCNLYREVGAPASLAELGLSREQLVEGIAIVMEQLPIDNPRSVTGAGITSILSSAYEGRPA